MARRALDSVLEIYQIGTPSQTLALHDRCFIDRTRLWLFERFLGTHGLFQNLGGWLWLSHRLKESAAQVFVSAHGPMNEAHSEQLHEIAQNTSGVLFWDGDQKFWAARVIDLGTTGWLSVGFSVEFPVGNAAGGIKDTVPDDVIRRVLEEKAAGLRLFKMTRQLVWLFHATFLSQATNPIVVPDIQCAEVVWGLNRQAWPRNWRRDIKQVLTSLCFVRWAHLKDVDELVTSNPLASADAAVIVDFADDRSIPAHDPSAECLDCCSLSLATVKHHHFRVRLGHGFMGDLVQFEENQAGVFDFAPDRQELLTEARSQAETEAASQKLPPDATKELVRAREEQVLERYRRQHQNLVPVPLATLILGDHAGISDPHRRLLCALLREVTRAPKAQAQRGDHAHLIANGIVAGKNPRTRTPCPYLATDKTYVGFNGNGKVQGIGYRLATWMHRAGYLPDPKTALNRKAARSFLKDLSRLASTHNLTVVALNGAAWLDLDSLLQANERQLNRLTLRVYAPADYLERWRELLYGAVKETLQPVTDTNPSSDPSS